MGLRPLPPTPKQNRLSGLVTNAIAALARPQTRQLALGIRSRQRPKAGTRPSSRLARSGRPSPGVPKRSRTSGLQRIALPPGPNRPRSQGRPRWENDADPTIHHHWPKCQRHNTQCAHSVSTEFTQARPKARRLPSSGTGTARLDQMLTAQHAMFSTPTPRSSRKHGPSPDDWNAAVQEQRLGIGEGWKRARG